jgi:hypothetical protein
MGAGLCAAWTVVCLSLVFGQMVIVDFSAARIAHWSRMTITTAPR